MSAGPTTCRACDEPLGVGRFCTNCGRPKDTPTTDDSPVTTAERPSVPPIGPSSTPA